MSDDKKIPLSCNHCNSTNIIHQVWGRTEFYSCKDCKSEVTYVEPKSAWTSWDPKMYGFNNTSTDFSFTVPKEGTYRVTLPDGNTYDTDKLPAGNVISVPRDINGLPIPPPQQLYFPDINDIIRDLDSLTFPQTDDGDYYDDSN